MGEPSFRGFIWAFIWAIAVGMGGHIGWGLISLLVELAAQALHRA